MTNAYIYFNYNSYKILVGLTFAMIVIFIGLLTIVFYTLFLGYQLNGVENAILSLQAENSALKLQNEQLIQDITKYKGYFYAVRFDKEHLLASSLSISCFAITATFFVRLFVL